MTSHLPGCHVPSRSLEQMLAESSSGRTLARTLWALLPERGLLTGSSSEVCQLLVELPRCAGQSRV